MHDPLSMHASKKKFSTSHAKVCFVLECCYKKFRPALLVLKERMYHGIFNKASHSEGNINGIMRLGIVNMLMWQAIKEERWL